MTCAGGVQLDCEPFPHCRIGNFVQNESFVENLRDEILRLNFHSKSNDLYKFQQVPQSELTVLIQAGI